MKRFSKFLAENIDVLENVFCGPETFIHVNENGDVVVETNDGDNDGLNPDEFSEFFSNSDEDNS